MEPGKKSNSEASSTNADQDDDHEALQVDQERPKEESMGVRSYECTFCKRGFTNAQALGGHMNIHRKDKAKAKESKHNKNIKDQVPAAGSFMDKNIKYSGYFPAELISSHHPDSQNLSAAGYYQLLNNYQVYLHPSSNPSPQIGNVTNPPTNHEPVLRMDLFGNDVDVDGNQLSLRIGLTTSTSTNSSPPVEEQNVKENEELDLELRLGQDP